MQKQDVQKQKQSVEFPDDILKKNHFKRFKDSITGNNPFLIFAQLLNKDPNFYKKELQFLCLQKIQKFYKRKRFPFFVRFLQEEPEFLEYYKKNQQIDFLLCLNLFLIAHIFDISIDLLYLNKNNQNFFSSLINPNKEHIVYMFSTIANNKNLQVSLLERTNKDTFQKQQKENCIQNILEKCEETKKSKEFKKYLEENEKQEIKTPVLRKRSSIKKNIKPLNIKTGHDAEYKKYKQILDDNYCPLYEYQKQFFNYIDEENIWTSAKKQMGSVFQKYTKSVNKNSVVGQNQFQFDDKKQQENESEDFSQYLQYTDYPPNVFLDTRPPGLPIQTYQNNIKIFQQTKKQHKSSIDSAEQQTKTLTPRNRKNPEFGKTYKGILKNFYINRNYGFVVIDDTYNDVFVHFNDLEKAGINHSKIKNSKEITLQFEVIRYKVNRADHMKAYNIKLVSFKQQLNLQNVIKIFKRIPRIFLQ